MMASGATPLWLTVAGIAAGPLLAAIVAILVANWRAKSESEINRSNTELELQKLATTQSSDQKRIELEVEKLKISQARALSERKLDIAYRFAELSEKNPNAASVFLSEIAKETAIGFISMVGDEQRQKIWVRDNANLLIGRRETCDIVLTDQAVSREHCILHAIDGQLFIVPLNPTNSVILNGTEIAGRRSLDSGAKLVVGSCYFEYFSLGE